MSSNVAQQQDRPYPTVFRMTMNAHLNDAIQLLGFAAIANHLNRHERERLFATTSIIHAFQATEDFLGVVRTMFIIGQKNVNKSGVHQIFDFLERQLGEIRPISEKWKQYAEIISGSSIDLGVSPFQEYAQLAKFRNEYLHARIVWLAVGESGEVEPTQSVGMGPFPNDPSLIRVDHGMAALKIAGDVIQRGLEIFVDFIPTEIHDGGVLCIFKKEATGAIHKTKFTELLKETTNVRLSEEIRVLVKREVLEAIGINVQHSVPPTADMVGIGLRLDKHGYGYTRVTGYRDPR